MGRGGQQVKTIASRVRVLGGFPSYIHARMA